MSGALKHNDTVHVLFDRPGRVFLEIKHNLRIFGNVWSLNGILIFRGSPHVFRSLCCSLTYLQIILECLRKSSLLEALTPAIYGTVNSQYRIRTLSPPPDQITAACDPL